MHASRVAKEPSAAAPFDATSPAATLPFEPTLLQPRGLRGRLIGWLVRHPLWLLAFLRRYRPIVLIGKWAVVTRHDDVAEALANHHAIAVPFEERIRTLNDGPNFLLGMADGAEYRWLCALVTQVFPDGEADTLIGPLAEQQAERILQQGRGRIDAVSGLLTLVPTRICQLHYGLPIEDERAFGQWTIAMSSFMFGNPADDPGLRQAALPAGAKVRAIVEQGIHCARAAPESDTVAARLVRAQSGDPRVTDEVIRAILIGMVTGFVPTNTMASGNMLQMLLSRPRWLAQARAAANAGDDDRLQRCLFEAMRFLPLNPGPFRVAAQDVELAKGTSRARVIPRGTNLLVSTQSAMFDPRRVPHPGRFDPDRAAGDYMLMGYGLHRCIGARLAEVQITRTFKPLLQRAGLRRARGTAGRMRRLGPFPESLTVEYAA